MYKSRTFRFPKRVPQLGNLRTFESCNEEFVSQFPKLNETMLAYKELGFTFVDVRSLAPTIVQFIEKSELT